MIVREIRDQGSNFRYEPCKARLLPSFVTITKSIFSFCFDHSFLRNAQVNKEKILPIVTNPIVTMVMVTIGREIRDRGSNFKHETCGSKAAAVLCYYIKKYFLFIYLLV